jgi:hypothetical protein
MVVILDVPGKRVKESGVMKNKNHQDCQHSQPINIVPPLLQGFVSCDVSIFSASFTS